MYVKCVQFKLVLDRQVELWFWQNLLFEVSVQLGFTIWGSFDNPANHRLLLCLGQFRKQSDAGTIIQSRQSLGIVAIDLVAESLHTDLQFLPGLQPA